LIVSVVFALTVTVCSVFLQLLEKGTKIVFCDVGQGNAAYIRTDRAVDLLVDAGPNTSVLNCLGKHMPFYDRQIEIIIITHLDLDHVGGLEHILKRYKVKKLIANEKIARKENIDFSICRTGDEISFHDVSIDFFWPSVNFSVVKKNDRSCAFVFRQNDFRLIFTGDLSPGILNKIYDPKISDADILVVPHHGSINGLTEKFLRLADPDLAVISCGKNNQFGHPHKEILDLLKAKKINIKRTDEEGDIKITLKE